MLDYTRPNSARGAECAPTLKGIAAMPYLRAPCRIWPILDSGVLGADTDGVVAGAAGGVTPQYPFIGELLQGYATLVIGTTGDVSDTVEIASVVVATRNQAAVGGPLLLSLVAAENQLNPWNFDPTTPGVNYTVTANNHNVAATHMWWVVWGRLLGCPS